MQCPTLDKLVLDGFTPAGEQPVRQAALASLCGVALPTHRDEEYKYSPLHRLAEVPWREGNPSPIDRLTADALGLPSVRQHRFVFINGVFNAEASDSLEIEGVSIEVSGDRLPEELGQLASIEAQKFAVAAHLGNLEKPPVPFTAAINTACFKQVTTIRFDKNAKTELPIHVVFISHGQHETSCPRLLVIAESGSEGTVIESYASQGGAQTLTLPVTEVHVHPNANLEHVRIEDENLVATNLGLVEVRQEKDSTYRSYNIVFGGQFTRNDINIFIDGSNAHTRFDGVVAIGGEQHVDNHTRLDHAQPHCESFEIYKHLIDGHANAVFNGKIFVHQDAQKTDAKQTNMTLLLSPTAQVNTKPQLEIFADDVKCTHGATIGQLREDAMFYLKSRGISEAEAKGMLVYAFAAEVLELIENDELKQALEARLVEKLAKS